MNVGVLWFIWKDKNTDWSKQTICVTKSQLVYPGIEFVSIISPRYVFWPNYEGPNTLILQLY